MSTQPKKIKEIGVNFLGQLAGLGEWVGVKHILDIECFSGKRLSESQASPMVGCRVGVMT